MCCKKSHLKTLKGLVITKQVPHPNYSPDSEEIKNQEEQYKGIYNNPNHGSNRLYREPQQNCATKGQIPCQGRIQLMLGK